MAVSPLNIQPRGLLDFFGVKSGEWGPRELSQVLQGNLDLWRHYVATNSIDVDGSITQIVGPFSNPATDRQITWTFPPDLPGVVPPGEVWYIDELAVIGVLSATAGSRLDALGVEFPYPVNGQQHNGPFPPIPSLVSDAANQRGMWTSMTYPYWAKPAQALTVGLALLLPAGATFDARVSGRLARLRV